MLEETERRLSRKYDLYCLRELEEAINAHPVIGWPARGQQFKETTFGLAQPYKTIEPGERGGGWVPTDRMIIAFQSLFKNEKFSAEVHLNGPHIRAIIERR